MDKLLTLFFIFVYLSSVCLLFTRKRQYLLHVTILFVTVNDLVFVHLNDTLGPLLVIAKTWKETFIGGLLLFNLVRSSSRRPMSLSDNTFRMTIVIMILSATGFAVGAIHGGIVESIQQWRRYFVPILLAALLASPGLPQRTNLRTVRVLLLSIACVMSVFAIYEYLTFDGDFTHLWYYNFVAQAKESIDTDAHLLQYQFMRGDALRSSGFFISAIEYSLFNALALTYAIISACTARTSSTRLIFIFVTMLLAGGEVVANVRIGWVACALALLTAAQVHFLRTRSFTRLAVAPTVILILSFLLIVFNKSALDASSVGRLAQYASVPSTFQVQGYGLGAIENNGATYKDSWYISVLMVFGVASAGYVWLMFMPLTRALHGLKTVPQTKLRGSGATYAFILGTIGFFFAQLYVFGFHYSTGLSHLYLLQIFMFNIASNVRSNSRLGVTSPADGLKYTDYAPHKI